MKNKILGLLIAAIIATPLSALANSDSKYPATNFQPKVIFADESATTSTEKSGFDANYLAVSF